jgi:glycosyltransferase involved in cell wall biosynthesis
MLLPLVKGLAEAGLDVVVVVLGQRAFAPERWIAAGARVFFVNGDDQTPLHTSRDALEVVRELRALIRIVEPSIVHAWCGEAWWLTLLAVQSWPLAGKLPPFRLLATELSLPGKHGLVRRGLQRRMLDQLEAIVVPHQQVATRLQKILGREHRFQTISTGCVGDVFLDDPAADGWERNRLRLEVRRGLRLPDDAVLAISMADLEPVHRLKDLVWATDLLACVRDDFHFLLVGSGTQRHRLRRFASLTEAGANVHLLGLIDQPERFLRAADVYWNSHLEHPNSVQVLSAMESHVPVVSVLGLGTEQMIRHQETGFAVNYGARDEFARWTKYLIEMPGPAERLALQAEQWAEQQFPVEAVVSGYMELYG